MTRLQNFPDTSGFISTTNYTAARAALLDRLALFGAGGAGELSLANAALLARLALLAAGGAGELTAARAALLSNADALVSGRRGAINATVRGTTTITDTLSSATATITAVVVARTEVRYLGSKTDGATANNTGRVTLTNATTVTVARDGIALNTAVSWELTEYAA